MGCGEESTGSEAKATHRLRAAIGRTRWLEMQLAADRDNPRLLVSVGHMCMRHRNYERANILFGRAIHLGVKNTRVYMARGEALMQVAETLSLTRVEEAVPRFITAAQMYRCGMQCGMLDGEARTVPALVCVARAMFRSNKFQDAAHLLGHLIERLTRNENRKTARKFMTEVSLMASQALYEIGQIKDALRYMIFAFNSVHDVYSLGQSGDLLDNDSDSDADDGDVFELRRGVPAEHVCALVLGLLTRRGASDSNQSEADRQALDLGSAIQYGFFRQRACQVCCRQMEAPSVCPRQENQR